MKSQERTDAKSLEPTGVQRDSETPVPQKPSFLFITSVSVGVFLIILLAVSAYFGVVNAP